MIRTPVEEWVSIDGLDFHICDWGGSGQPIVLLHGLASTCHIWDLVAPLLAKELAQWYSFHLRSQAHHKDG